MSSITGTSAKPILTIKQNKTAFNSANVASGAFNDDKTINHDANTNIAIGMTVTASGGSGSGVIPAAAYVESINSNTSFELSAATTGGNHTGATLTFTTGVLACIQEVGRQSDDMVTINGANQTANYTTLRNTIHMAGAGNAFFGSDPTLPANNPTNLLTGCRLYKLVDASGTDDQYWRTFLYTKDQHGLTVDTGSTLQNLVDSRTTNAATKSDYAVSAAFTVRPFAEPLRVISNPTTQSARVNFGDVRGGYAGVAGIANLSGGVFNGLFDIVMAQDAFDCPKPGEEIYFPAGIQGETMNAGIANIFMYYVLDEDNIIFYTDLAIYHPNMVVPGGVYNDDEIITHTANTSIQVGMKVTSSEAGMPSNSRVVSVTDTTHFTIQGDTTDGSKTGANLTFRNRRLSSPNENTFAAFGKAGGVSGGVDDFFTTAVINPTSLAITTSESQCQTIPRDGFNIIEFWATGGDTTIRLGLHKNLASANFDNNSPYFGGASPTIIIPQDTRTQVAINVSRIGGFKATTSNGSGDTLYWNYISG